ncbi:fimbrial protein [Erwinia billingiae]|uniref:fimbrial protein n=1 Tax=Erwinia billingiae TaxID=182337 RepID=UPI0032093098
MDGEMMVGTGATYKPGVSDSFFGLFSSAFVKVAGVYIDRIHICPTTTKSKCTIAASTDQIDGAQSFMLNMTQPISDQSPNAGGPAKALTLNYSYSFCQTLVDDQGNEWSSEDATSCADGKILPNSPPVCSINSGANLNVELGTLERSAITSTPVSGVAGNIKKTVAVVCTGDLVANVKTQFQYTPITVNENQVVATSNKNLGVAIFYQGKVVGPENTFDETFTIGTTNIDFEFSAVRDSKVATKDIATGDFSASAVMVMTMQ